MKDESLDLNSFLDEMVSLINRRFKKQEKRIAELEKMVDDLRDRIERTGKGKPQIDKRVLRVLSGK